MSHRTPTNESCLDPLHQAPLYALQTAVRGVCTMRGCERGSLPPRSNRPRPTWYQQTCSIASARRICTSIVRRPKCVPPRVHGPHVKPIMDVRSSVLRGEGVGQGGRGA